MGKQADFSFDSPDMDWFAFYLEAFGEEEATRLANIHHEDRRRAEFRETVEQPYFEVQDVIFAALEQRNYRTVALELPVLLSLISAYSSEARLRSWPLPTFDGALLASASMFGSIEVDRLLETVSDASDSPVPAAYRNMVDLRNSMNLIMEALQGGPLDRNALRALSGVSGRIYSRALGWLVKAEQVYENEGAFSLEGREPAKTRPIRPLDDLPAKSTRQRVTAALVDLNKYPRLPGDDPYRIQASQTPALRSHALNVLESELQVTPGELRISGSATTLTTSNTSWLLTYKQPIGSKWRVWSAALFDADGLYLKRVDLPGGMLRWAAGPDRQYVVVLGADFELRIFHETGELIRDLDISSIDEIAERLEEGVWMLRAIDHDFESGHTIVSFNDSFWVADQDSNILWGARFPQKVYPSGAWAPGMTPTAVTDIAVSAGLRPDLSAREAVSALDAAGLLSNAHSPAINTPTSQSRQIARKSSVSGLLDYLGEITPDRIEAVRRTKSGWTASSAYGMNVDFDRHGSILRMWNTKHAIYTQSELAHSRLASTGAAVLHIADEVFVLSGGAVLVKDGDQSVDPSPARELALLEGVVVSRSGWIAAQDGTTINVYDDKTASVVSFTFPKRPSAIVPTKRGMRIHIGTRHTEIFVEGW